jgi:hypothetical protein
MNSSGVLNPFSVDIIAFIQINASITLFKTIFFPLVLLSGYVFLVINSTDHIITRHQPEIESGMFMNRIALYIPQRA